MSPHNHATPPPVGSLPQGTLQDNNIIINCNSRVCLIATMGFVVIVGDIAGGLTGILKDFDEI